MRSRVILVTGANGGLGRAIARAFLEEANSNFVWLGVHRSREEADRLKGEFAGRCDTLQLNVRQSEDWERSLEEITAKHGRLDVLVNNAGQHRDALLAQMSPADWDEVVSTNLTATFHGCRMAIPVMIGQRSGRVINVASLSALLPPAGQANYAAAKAGMVALTQSLAKEVARIGITVNAVCPGYIETESLEALGPEEREAARMRVPMRRFGRPAEVAAAIRFLACPDAAYITGSVLKIDGGIL
jgi:3-oxoacyl-[acyl-carrier protein] reductase